MPRLVIMAKIELLFGGPTTPKREKNIEEWIYDCDINYETAVILKLKSLVNSLAKRNNEDDNYFELVVSRITQRSFDLPTINFGTYRHNGFVLPKIIFHDIFMVNRATLQKKLINQEIIDQIGIEFEYEFSFEYFSFNIEGKVKPRANDVIYQLRNKPHMYCSGKFLEIYRGV